MVANYLFVVFLLLHFLRFYWFIWFGGLWYLTTCGEKWVLYDMVLLESNLGNLNKEDTKSFLACMAGRVKTEGNKQTLETNNFQNDIDSDIER